MATKVINGEQFKQMIVAAAGAIEQRRDAVNELNVFPVPDGDTGTNMALTLGAAANELKKLDNPTLGRALEVTSSAVLRGARGNSGVITSLLLRGFAKGVRAASEMDGGQFAVALSEGVATAYKAVLKPAEGTILTVSRVSSEAAMRQAQQDKDAARVLEAAIEAAKAALPLTTEQNPVLKQANVIDAGAYGYVLILEGMYAALTGKIKSFLKFEKPSAQISVKAADFSQFEIEEITFAYCTEFIAEREDKRRSVEKLRHFLESIGDSVVVVDDDELVKVHVHTDTPDRALSEGLRFGQLSSIKIENMHEQLERKHEQGVRDNMKKRTVRAPEKRYGFVSVAAGEGVRALFQELGVDNLVEGGQTMNPSTEDILDAVDKTPAEVVFVLPNNKNIIMASQQAASLSEKQVIVLETKSIPQGMAAMIAFDGEREPELNRTEMHAAIERVKTGQITFAARDSEFGGKKIKQGDFIGIVDGRLTADCPKFEDAAQKLARALCSKKTEFVTILYNDDASEAQVELMRRLCEKEAKDAEINLICGGQPVYSFIVSAE